MALVLYGVEALLHVRVNYHGVGLNREDASELRFLFGVVVIDWFGEGGVRIIAPAPVFLTPLCMRFRGLYLCVALSVFEPSA